MKTTTLFISPGAHAANGEPPVVIHQVLISGVDRPLSCRQGQSVLTAVSQASRGDIQIGCRGGGCGVCLIDIHKGCYTSRKMSAKAVGDGGSRRALACCVFPTSDLHLSVPDRKGLFLVMDGCPPEVAP